MASTNQVAYIRDLQDEAGLSDRELQDLARENGIAYDALEDLTNDEVSEILELLRDLGSFA